MVDVPIVTTPAPEPKQPRPAMREVDTGLIARLGAKASSRAKQLKEQGVTIAKLTADLAEANKRSDGTVTSKRIADLEGQIRAGSHRAAFDRLARKEGASDDVLDDLWTLSGVDTSGKVDEAALATQLAAHKAHATRGRLFGGDEETETETEPSILTEAIVPGGTKAPAVKKPGPAKGRGNQNGGGADPVSDELVLHDAAYVMKNYDRVVASARAKLGWKQV